MMIAKYKEHKAKNSMNFEKYFHDITLKKQNKPIKMFAIYNIDKPYRIIYLIGTNWD